MLHRVAKAPSGLALGHLLLGLLACLCLAGCEEDAAVSQSRLCQNDEQCAPDLVCDFSHCVAPGVNAQALHLRITPPTTSGLLAQHVPNVDFSDGPDRLVQLLTPSLIAGVVVPEGDNLTTNMPGTITVKAAGDIPGLVHVFTTQSLAGLNEDNQGYTLSVLPSRRYEGTFRPDDRQLPRHKFVIEAGEVNAGIFNITLPSADSYQRITGRVRTSDYLPIAGARVLALGEDGTVWGITETDAIRGQFDLVLPPTLTRVRYKIEAPDQGPLFPDFVTRFDSVTSTETSVDVTIPPLPPGTEAFGAVIVVTGLDADGHLVPVTGTTLTIVGDLAGGTLRRTTTTDDTGTAYLEALPGAYECIVATSADQRFSSWHGRLDLIADKPITATIALQERLSLYGTARDFIGIPIVDGEIEATRRVDKDAGDRLAIAPSPFRGVVVSGEFHLRVDPGYYDIRVTPSLVSRAPPMTLRNQDVTGGKSLDLLMPRPGLAHITIAAPAGGYVGNAMVEIFDATEVDSSADDTPFLLTRGNTGDDGYIDLLIPHATTSGAP